MVAPFFCFGLKNENQIKTPDSLKENPALCVGVLAYFGVFHMTAGSPRKKNSGHHHSRRTFAHTTLPVTTGDGVLSWMCVMANVVMGTIMCC